MKIKADYIMREVAGMTVIVRVSGTAGAFNGTMKCNDTAKLLFTHLQQGATRDALVQALREEYPDVEESRLAADTDAFLATLRSYDMLEE